MHIKTRNVNTAFRELIRGIHDGSIQTARTTSRVGDVLQIPEPVILTYSNPRERVLFNSARDANPFFHVYEALWMLAGRNDIAPVAYYAANYAKQVQDGDSPTANGAYGYRWRHMHYPRVMESQESAWIAAEQVDQLKLIVEQLKAKPDSRRCVLQMWNVEDDLLKIDTSKDVCCNTHVYFSLRRVQQQDPGDPVSIPPKWMERVFLDMTVCNRSNDLIWGTLGANVVHFSFLQEYLAACIGCEVGIYNQFSNNQHVYTDRFEPEKWLADETPDLYQIGNRMDQPWEPVEKPFPLVKDPATFDRECAEFVEQHSKVGERNGNCFYGDHKDWSEPFLADVAEPMCIAFHWHKKRWYDLALEMAGRCKADDWQIAATNWLLKRQAAYERKCLLQITGHNVDANGD